MATAISSLFRVALAGLTAAPLMAGAASGAGPDAIALKPDGAPSHVGLAVSQFAADSTLKAPVERLKADQSWPVSSLNVALNTDPGLCGDHAIARVVELPNQDAAVVAAGDGPDCIFGALLTIVAGPKRFEIATECGDWIANVANCWGFGQTGEFRLARDREQAPAQFRLVFPGPAPAGADAAAADKDSTAQRHGLFLDTVLDDRKEPMGDLWMVWTGATVEIAFTR